MVGILAAVHLAEFATDLVQTAKANDPGDGSGGLLDPPIDDKGVELVGERAGLLKLAYIIHFPFDGNLAPLVLLSDVDGNATMPRQPMNREAGKGGFDPDRSGRQDFAAEVRDRIHQ